MAPSSSSEGDAPTIASNPGGSDLPDTLADQLDERLAPGDEVGEYVVEGVLGEGGFGTVYDARHPLIGKRAAIKVLARQFSTNREMVSRFISEARAVNTIRHTNIIDVFSFGTLDDGRHYFVMELLEGATLDRFLDERGAMAPPDALAVLRGVARALDAAHDKGIVHRDLKPENVFLTYDDDGRPVPKLLDFGIAKLTGEAGAISGHRTRTGAPIGTPRYMSPEQCMGEEVSQRSDVYAFGVVAFELLSNQLPFDDNSLLGLMNKHASAARPALSEHIPEVGRCFDEVLRSIMAIDPELRPATAGEAWTMLAEAGREGGYVVEGVVSKKDLPALPKSSPVAEAATQRAGSLASHTGPPSTAVTGGPSRWPVVAAALALLAGVGTFVALSRSTPESDASVAASSQEASLGDPATPGSHTAAAPASATAAQGPTSAAPVAATIELRVETKVRDAEVFVDGEHVGAAPGAISLPAAPGDHEVVVRAPGHEDATRRGPLHDGDILSLEPRPLPATTPAHPPSTTPVPRGATHEDLEDPY
ncbi:MAG: serine/threonine protein kinase [Myxococcales bacterium]|nr:serine/threonine protein kinase [Myxococcales bacterium]